MKNKKGAVGLTSETIILLVMSVIILVFVLYALGILKPETENIVDRSICEQSVFLNSQPVARNIITDEIDCETSRIKINTINENEIKEKIADEIFLCWKQFGKGESFFLREVDFFNNPKICYICSKIIYGDNLKNKFDFIYMKDYLANTIIPTKEITYMNYLTTKNYLANRLENIEPINTKFDTYIIFIADKGKFDPLLKFKQGIFIDKPIDISKTCDVIR